MWAMKMRFGIEMQLDGRHFCCHPVCLLILPFAEHKSYLVRLEWTIEVLNPTRRLGTLALLVWGLRCEVGHFICRRFCELINLF